MVVSVQNPTDVVNLALVRIGYQGRIGNLYDGSRAAKKALDIYAQTRDELLRVDDWGFAERNVKLTLLKQAPPGGYISVGGWTPDYPSIPWFFEYAYPDDCLKVRALKPEPIFVQEFDPQPFLFSVENDKFLVPQQKVILCNIQSALLTYTGQVTDPTEWEANFVEVFAAALGRRLAPALVSLDAAKLAAQDEAVSMSVAQTEQG